MANLTLEMTEGRNRQIRRTFKTLGYNVKQLNRIGIGKLALKNLKPGQFKHITPEEVK